MHIWHRMDRASRWEREEIPDEGLALGLGPDGSLEIGRRDSDRTLAAIVPFEERRVWRGALLTLAGGATCLLNGFPPLSATVLEERDELIVGGQVIYFGAHAVAANERFVQEGDPARCPRCKGGISAGDEIMRCPACRAAHHEGALADKPEEIRPCFSYHGEPCAACGRSVDDLHWSPEEVWE